MTSRERVKRTIAFDYPDRVPRDLWTLPIALEMQSSEIERILKKYPLDIERAKDFLPLKRFTKGEQYEIGTYTDEWNCAYENIQRGVHGQVKNPLVKNLSDLERVKPPYELLDILESNISMINDWCRRRDKFVIGGGAAPFQRMQYLRGTPNLLMDIMDLPPEFFQLRDTVHSYLLKKIEVWCKTDVDAIIFADDWGSQKSLLISPVRWRELFKPLYKEYCEMIHKAHKSAFMHSDGYISDILEDLIEIGVDAINSQLFCMNIEEIGKRYGGRITFWGELDRQHALPSTNPDDVRRAATEMKERLFSPAGGVIAQCEFGAGALSNNIELFFKEWENI
jgi:hypothetical protein